MNFEFEEFYDQALINYKRAMKKHGPFLGSEEMLSAEEEVAIGKLDEAREQLDVARQLFFGM